jgi:type I restriction enzyme R subunit
MWLTGFDAPSLHTMYVDKPMQGHGLMQAIARVNRVFRDKPGGLVVDYIGLGTQLRQALATYTESRGKGSPTIDQAEAVAGMLEKLENLRDLFHGLDYAPYLSGTPADRLGILRAAREHVLAQEDGTERLNRFVTELSQAFALAVPQPEALGVRSEVAFFQALRAANAKDRPTASRGAEVLDHAVRQIVSDAVTSEGIVDIFEAAGLDRPDLSILSDEFLAEVRGLPQKNLAVEALRRLLEDEVRVRSARNVMQGRKFGEMLDRAITRYHNKAIETAQVIEQLIELAKEMRAAQERGEQLGLTDAEIAFYDALETSEIAVAAMGDDVLKAITRDLVEAVRNNATVDWTIKESARARLRVAVRRLLNKYGYPPEKREQATATVLRQAELFAEAHILKSSLS